MSEERNDNVRRLPVTWRETPPVLGWWALYGLLSWAVLFGLVLAARALAGLL